MEPPSSGRIGVINESGKRLQTARIRRAVELALAASDASQCELCILLTTDSQVQLLNQKFRGVDEPTDVLSFPSGSFSPSGASTDMGQEPATDPLASTQDPGLRTLPTPDSALRAFLGDIAIAVPYAGRQAQVRGTTLSVELQYLAIHGVLHLLGWDDEEEEDRRLMQAEMNRLGAIVGLPAESEWCSVLHEPEGVRAGRT